MGAVFSAEDILETAEGRLAAGMMPDREGPIGVDTRQSLDGAWYLALKGRQFDGHDFIGEAFSDGAIGCIVEERTSYPIASTSFPLIAVTDTLEAYASLASLWRRKLEFCLVATIASTAEDAQLMARMVCRLLAGRTDTKLVGEYFSHLREYLAAILALPEQTRVVALPVVLRSLDEIEILGRSCRPDALIMTESPFEFLRLTADPVDRQATVFRLVNAVRERNGLLSLAQTDYDIEGFCQRASVKIDVFNCRENLVGVEGSRQLVVGDGEVGLPSWLEASAGRLWSVLTVCEHLGYDDLRIDSLDGILEL